LILFLTKINFHFDFRLSEYKYSKLFRLFEAIPSTVKIFVDGNGEKVVQLIESTSDDDSVSTCEENQESDETELISPIPTNPVNI
jgi:hypothetical protein